MDCAPKEFVGFPLGVGDKKLGGRVRFREVDLVPVEFADEPLDETGAVRSEYIFDALLEGEAGLDAQFVPVPATARALQGVAYRWAAEAGVGSCKGPFLPRQAVTVSR